MRPPAAAGAGAGYPGAARARLARARVVAGWTTLTRGERSRPADGPIHGIDQHTRVEDPLRVGDTLRGGEHPPEQRIHLALVPAPAGFVIGLRRQIAGPVIVPGKAVRRVNTTGRLPKKRLSKKYANLSTRSTRTQ